LERANAGTSFDHSSISGFSLLSENVFISDQTQAQHFIEKTGSSGIQPIQVLWEKSSLYSSLGSYDVFRQGFPLFEYGYLTQRKR